MSQQRGEDRILKTNSTEEEIILISASKVEGWRGLIGNVIHKVWFIPSFSVSTACRISPDISSSIETPPASLLVVEASYGGS